MAKYAINQEGANALKNLASGMLINVNEIIESGQSLKNIVNSYGDDLGIYADEISAIVSANLRILAANRDEIIGLATRINSRADEIQTLVSMGLVDGVINSGSLDTNFNGSGIVNSSSISGDTTYGSSADKQRLLDEAAADWSATLSPAEYSALQDYTREQPAYYKNINSKLRGKSLFYEEGNRDRAIAIHSALQRASVPCDCTVYRGASFDSLGRYKKLSDDQLIGKVLLDKGFMSTSTKKGSELAGDIKFEIAVPAGARGAYLGNGISMAGNVEHELLFDAGSRLKVTGVRYDENNNRIIQVRMM